MSDVSTSTADGEWQDWAEVASADLADPTFRALVDEIEADQTWAREYSATLAGLRKALRITQADVAQRLGASQSEVSRIERRDDVLVSTLRGFVRALGADLELVARFPRRPCCSDRADRRRMSPLSVPPKATACGGEIRAVALGADTELGHQLA